MWGYPIFKQSPPDPPHERLRIYRWGQFYGAPLGYFELFTWQSTAGPREVPELEVGERPPSTIRNVDDVPRGGADAMSGSDHHRN
jgi:hypothetical protein